MGSSILRKLGRSNFSPMIHRPAYKRAGKVTGSPQTLDVSALQEARFTQPRSHSYVQPCRLSLVDKSGLKVLLEPKQQSWQRKIGRKS